MIDMAAAPFRVAAVQAAPAFLDLEAALGQACDLVSTAARAGARLVVFPEVFLAGYPDWVWMLPARDRAAIDELYADLVASAVTIPSQATERLCRAAREAGVFIVIGANERNVEASGASLYNTLLFIDAQGQLVGRHRKLVPTGGERLVWGQGDGSTLQVYDTPFGKLAGLICWENYMPLARYALYAWGMQILVSATWDRGEPWLSTLRHIAKEGRTFVIGCCQAVHRDDIPDRFPFKKLYPEHRAWINAGDSAIVDPDGRFIAGPLHEKQDILYAEIDPRRMTAPRWMLDVAGHYGRPDLFELTVRKVVHPMLKVSNEPPQRPGERATRDRRS